MSIVCGTDFSENADRAARSAAALAAWLGQPLVLLHVVEPGSARGDPGTIASSYAEGARTDLRARAGRLRARGIDVREEVHPGFADESLLQCARQHRARAVVVAALGKRPIGRWRLGSAAERLVRAGEFPVLVARPCEALETWEPGGRRVRILVGYDSTHAGEAAVHWVAALRAHGPCDVVVAHAYRPYEEAQRLGLHHPAGPHGGYPEVEMLLERELARRIGTLPGEGETRLLVEPTLSRIASCLLHVAARERCDLVVLGTHARRGLDRLWHGSVAAEVVEEAPLPVVCVPAEAVPAKGPVTIPALRRILVPTDFSALANRAVPYAYAALSRGGTVILLHVHVLPGPMLAPDAAGAGLPAPSMRSLGERAADERHEARRLSELIPPQAAGLGIETELHVVEGWHVPSSILETAARLDVDEICLASHGRTGVARLVLGSVAQELLRRAHRPVRIVPPARDE